MTAETNAATGRVLVLFAHPALEKSRINRALVDELEGADGITVHDLYEVYPDLHVDVRREQALLVDHDVIVMQHPLFWYSTPAILKEWQDLVLEHGWAYGSEGRALHGKTLISAVTTGGKADAYARGGFNGNSVREFLLPIAQTAKLCGMRSPAPFVVHGALRMSQESLSAHAGDYRRLLTALRDGRLDLDRATDPDLPYVNRELDALIREAV